MGLANVLVASTSAAYGNIMTAKINRLQLKQTQQLAVVTLVFLEDDAVDDDGCLELESDSFRN